MVGYLLPQLSTWASEEADNAAAVADEVVEATALTLLVRLPLFQRGKQRLALYDNVKVESKKHRHPCLGQLIVFSCYETGGESTDQVQELVGLVVPVARRK